MKVRGGYRLELSLGFRMTEGSLCVASGGKHSAKTAPGPARLTRARETLTCEVRTKVHSRQQEEVLLGGSVSSLPDRKFSKLL